VPAHGFTTSLWFDGQAEEAARFYTSVFPDGKLGRVMRATAASPSPVGSVVAVEFEINGQRFLGINGGPQFTFTEAISFQIHCADQKEIDYYWERLAEEGGQEVACGWAKDRYGVAWQVIPTELIDMTADPDITKAERATRAMLSMVKLDLAELRRAYHDE
jgi:predicted 3-demethylubiquinone-9 3-methyltransferase (glyoxalase superfamily)